MTIEAYTNGREILFRRRRQTALPSDAPPAYARSMLGPQTIAWLEATHKGISRNKVQRLKETNR
jgi:hypothetical protein